jgi:hypothetical protein
VVHRLARGRSLRLSGQTSGGVSGEHIGLLVLRRGLKAPRRIYTIVTSAGGHWTIVVRPRIDTDFSVRWGSGLSQSFHVSVLRPPVELSASRRHAAASHRRP